MDDKIKDFESAVGELEIVVKTLEAGDISLEKSLQLFERGVQLSRFCHGRLADAERRVEMLSEHGERQNAPDALIPNQEADDQA
jgi:exodeoxyribonuclease VII small subunit